MRDIDIEIINGRYNEETLNMIIKNHEFFIVKCASDCCGRYVSRSDDEWSIALCAFSEAIREYAIDKGSFYGFTKLVIARRLTDHLRLSKRRENEILIDPTLFAGSASSAQDTELQADIIKNIQYEEDNSLKLEIEAISEILLSYGFSFYDLIKCSPKSEKTKTACREIVNEVLIDIDLLTELFTTKQLPIKYLQKRLNLPRKIFDRHRKYIIAVIEILHGEFPYLSAYMYSMRKEAAK